MSWFKQKKESDKAKSDFTNRPLQTAQDEKKDDDIGEVIFRAFSRTGFNRSRGYKIPVILTLFSSNFDNAIQDLITTCNMDKYNDNFADSTIESNEELAINEIEKQHIENLDALRTLKSQTWPTELVEYNNALMSVQQKMTDCENELKKLRSIKNQGTVYEEDTKSDVGREDSTE